MDEITHYLFQWSQYEIALTDQRMGNPELRRVDNPTVVKQDIDIHRSRGISLPGTTNPSETLFDALAKGDLENAVQIQRKLSLSRESAPPQTIAGLAYCFRRLADWHKTAEQAGGRADSGMLKRAGFTSTKAQNQYRMAAARWDAETVRRILAMLAAADEEARSTGDRLQNTAFEFLLYKIAKAGEKDSNAAQTEKSARGRITNARERRF